MTMQRYTPEELAEVLRLHKLWLEDQEGGVRANLAGANLAGANLDRATLAEANLAGANLAGTNLAGTRDFLPFICIGPIGSRRGYTTANLVKDEIRCGCFAGTLEAFEAKVRRTHANNPFHPAEYLALVTMVKAVREAQPSRGEATPEPPAPFVKGDQVQLAEAGRERWPWAPTGEGRVLRAENGWILIDYPDRYLRAPYDFVAAAASVTKEGATA